MASDNDSYALSFSSGGQVLPHLNRISNDGHYSIAFFNNHVTVYSITSRLAIRSFHTLGDVDFEDIIDTYIFPSSNNNLIYILSKKQDKPAYITIVNWYDNVKDPIVSSIELSLPEEMGGAVEMINSQDDTTLNLLLSNASEKSLHIVPYDLNKNKALPALKDIEAVTNYSISTNRKNIAFIMKNGNNFRIFTFDDTNGAELAYYTTQYTGKITPLICAISDDLTNPLIAFGTNNGTIILLFNLTSQGPATQKILKWHMGPAKSLAFSPDSTYLLSGGSEKVLVFWNVMNEKQQFLPRLNGTIENIFFNSSVPSLICLSLNVIDCDREYLIVGTADLLSKLDVSTPHLFAGMNKENAIKKKVYRDIHSAEKSGRLTKFKHPYKLRFNINNKNNHIYLQAGRHIQVYDSLHNLQLDNIAVAPAIQQYGKIGSENKIQDPMVVGSEFVYCSKTNEQDWLVTCDAEIRGEAEELTKDSIEHWETLKFWKNTNDKESNGNSWTLQTKMLRPHGDYPITAIVPAPKSYFGGEAVLTADTRGNVRLWRPNAQGIWSLRKLYSSGSESAATSKESQIKKVKDLVNIANSEGTVCTWSPDSSLIAVGRDGKVMLLDVNTFEPIHTIKPAVSASRFHTHATIDNSENNELIENKILNPHSKTRYIDINLQDKHIISINFTSNGKLLVIETHSHLTVVDILKNKTLFGMMLCGENASGFGGAIVKLTSRSKSNINAGEQTDLNHDTTDELLVIGKYIGNKSVSSKLTLWNISDKKTSIQCKFSKIYENPIIGAEWSEAWQQWVLADTNSNFGELGYGRSYSRKVLVKENETKETDNWIVSSLLDNARIVNRASNAAIAENSNITNLDSNTEDYNDRQGLKGGAFDGILDHLEGVSMSTLFERVLRVV